MTNNIEVEEQCSDRENEGSGCLQNMSTIGTVKFKSSKTCKLTVSFHDAITGTKPCKDDVNWCESARLSWHKATQLHSEHRRLIDTLRFKPTFQILLAEAPQLMRAS